MDLHKKSFLHKVFRFSIALKAFNGIFEIVSGLILFFISSQVLTKFIQGIANRELIEDPHDFIGIYLFNFSQNFSLSTQHFVAVYLIISGLIKIILISGLWSGKLWAYPLSGVILSLLVSYSIFRVIFHFSFILFMIILLDLVILILLHFEYDRIKNKKK